MYERKANIQQCLLSSNKMRNKLNVDQKVEHTENCDGHIPHKMCASVRLDG